jgi:hypothetical protein
MAALIIALLLVFAGALLGLRFRGPASLPCGGTRAAESQADTKVRREHKRTRPHYPSTASLATQQRARRIDSAP